MPAITLTKDEIAILGNAMELSIASAKRAQNNKRSSPQLVEVYKTHERVETALLHKILDAK